MVADKDNRDLRQALRDLPVPSLSDQARRDLLERMLQIHQAGLEAGPPGRPSSAPGRVVSRRARRLLAAGLLLGVTIVGLWALLRNCPAAAGVRFEDVTQKLRQMETMRYRLTLQKDARILDEYEISVAGFGAHLRYLEIPEGKTAVYDYEQGKILLLSPTEDRTASLRRIEPGTRARTNPVEALANLHADANAASGEQRLDGRRTILFTVAGDGLDARVWVDPQTNLPTRIEIPHAKTPPSQSGSRATVVIDRIEWEPRLSPSIFALTLPEDYVWVEQRIASAVEDDLLDMLKLWTHHEAARFPAQLDQRALSKTALWLIAQAGHDYTFRLGSYGQTLTYVVGPPKDLFDKGRLGLRFVRKVADRDWHYQGAGVRLGDADAAVCWWRDEKPGIFRVVYGDLSVRDHAESDLETLRRRPPATAPTTRP